MKNKNNHTEVYTYKYPHPAVATDCVVFGFDGKDLRVLLIERRVEPYKGMWAFTGGFLRMDETAEECARRELKEETGLELVKVRELGTFSDVNRDPRDRIISIAFYSLARHSEVKGGDDAVKAKWWAIDDIPHLAFDHDYILRKAMKRIRQDIHFEPVGFDMLDEQFTIAELQRLYESILGVRFDRRNFCRKMLQTGVLQEVDEGEFRKPSYFGGRKEMRTRDVDELFGGTDKDTWGLSMDLPSVPGACDSEEIRRRYERLRELNSLLATANEKEERGEEPLAMMCEAAATLASSNHSVGRKGKLYRFNAEKYNQMKEDGNFRLEF